MNVASVATSTFEIEWASPVTTDDGATPDGNFTLDFTPIDIVQTVDPTHTQITVGGENGGGLPWEIHGWPNWLITEPIVPQSGLTT